MIPFLPSLDNLNLDLFSRFRPDPDADAGVGVGQRAGTRMGYSPTGIDIIITPATPHMPYVSEVGMGMEWAPAPGSGTGWRGREEGSTSAENPTSSGDVRPCARVLGYEAGRDPHSGSDLVPRSGASSASASSTVVGAGTGMGTSTSRRSGSGGRAGFFGYDGGQDESEVVDHDKDDEADIEESEGYGGVGRPDDAGRGFRLRRMDGRAGLRSDPASSHLLPSGTSSSSSPTPHRSSSNWESTPVPSRTKLNLLAFFLALFLASLGVASMMIPDLVHIHLGGIRVDLAPPGQAHGHGHGRGWAVGGMGPGRGEEGYADGGSSGRAIDGLKARGRPGSERRGGWGFGFDWVHAPFDLADIGSDEHPGPRAASPGRTLPERKSRRRRFGDPIEPPAGPAVEVVPVEHVQRLLLQQSRDRLRRRQEALKARRQL